MSDDPQTRGVGDDVREDVLVRLRRIEGQVRGVARMVEEQRDCRDIVTQLSAVRAAVSSLSGMVAEAYARQCLCAHAGVDADDITRLIDVLKAAR
ncbi:MAG: metal-sensitive transcriptional regulator [Chloroflexi bacterium]|jgi:DNA-binding FrmR family transcriptional regulator|nr:metal-sensitive transcriptional regulator [Chloroflexota bacterium]